MALSKDVVLLQLALLIVRGERLSHARLRSEFGLERRTATRYLKDLKDAGLPIAVVQEGRERSYALHHLRSKLNLEAVDVSPAVAKSLSLLVVAAALLPKNLGVREAVDRTVRQALRLRGLKMAGELRRLEDAVLVLENDAKDYTGREEIFSAVFDAVLDGRLLEVDYLSPRRGRQQKRLYAATIGLYRGGLYVLGIEADQPAEQARWWALERFDDAPVTVDAPLLSAELRRAAVASARARWGPAAPLDDDEETLVTLHFSPRAAPFVRARPWHAHVEMAPWHDPPGMRVSLRLRGETFMLESWLLSWGAEVQVLRPASLASKLAAEQERAARAHREASDAFAKLLADDA